MATPEQDVFKRLQQLEEKVTKLEEIRLKQLEHKFSEIFKDEYTGEQDEADIPADEIPKRLKALENKFSRIFKEEEMAKKEDSSCDDSDDSGSPHYLMGFGSDEDYD